MRFLYQGLPRKPSGRVIARSTSRNAALVDTGETAHVAILLSPDGGTRNLTMYVGQKGINASGAEASDFLSRNGLAFGSLDGGQCRGRQVSRFADG